jgi:proline racemase
MEVSTLDYHTAGEPLRIVTAGLPDIAGRTMLEKRRFFREELDAFRRFLMLEPRGHADMYGAVLTEAVTADGDRPASESTRRPAGSPPGLSARRSASLRVACNGFPS